jgi:hypothetical protein
MLASVYSNGIQHENHGVGPNPGALARCGAREIPALKRLKQKDHEFNTNLGYVERLSQNTKKKKKI